MLSTSKYVLAVIRHSKIVYIILAASCLLGLIGLDHINKDEFPTFDIKQGLVAAVYPGTTAEQVEEQLTKPLEELLLSVTEVNRSNLESISKDGIAYIYVDLDCPQSRKAEIWSKIKHKLSQAKLSLPPGVLTVQVLDDFSDITSVMIAIESDDKGWNEMHAYATDLKERLRRIERLGSVSIIGEQQEEIAVLLDFDKLSTYGISPSSLMLDYAADNLDLPSGKFDTEYTSCGITVSSTTASEDEIAGKIIYSDPDGNIVRLEDVATVQRRTKAPTSQVFYNSHPALILNLVMRPDNNIVAFGRDVDAVMEEFQATLPSSVHISRISDQPDVVENSVMGFLRDLLVSMLVVIFVMIMMFPMRSALIASSGVPVCTMITVAVMFLTGMCLNTVTLAALIVVLGMIVDDSIITMDGYMDKLSRGVPREEAAAASARELFMPMFMATLSICAMFFPMLGIITGYLGDFIKSFPWIVLIALMTSLVYAVTVVPSLEVRFITKSQDGEGSTLSRMQNRLFSSLQKGYDKVQVRAFNHPWLTIGVGVAAVVLGILMFAQLNIQMMPFAARNNFAVEIYLENGCNIDDTRAVADSLQKMLRNDRRVESVTAFVGTGAPRYHCTYSPKLPAPTFAQLIVNTKSNMATEQMLPYVEARYEHYFPKAHIHVKQMDYQGTSAPVTVYVSGSDREAVKVVADTVKNHLAAMTDCLKWVHSEGGDCTGSVKVVTDPYEASRFGVDKTMLSLAIGSGFGSTTLMTLYEGDRATPVNLYNASVSDTVGYEAIGDLMVPSLVPSVSVPVSQVAQIVPDYRPTHLVRYASLPTVSIAADLKYGHSHPAVMKTVQSFVSGLESDGLIPEGVEISYGGLSATNSTVLPQIVFSFIAAVAVMFLFLMLHYKKVGLTILSLVLSLLCLFGASFGLWAFNLDFGMTSVLGIVSLIGIIVRNGIIMFEYAEELHFEQGYSVRQAAMLSGQRRMRPIFLTSCTTALGVLPMILSGDALWQPMGLVICFGIMFSILLIVFIMPVSYWKVFDRGEKKD